MLRIFTLDNGIHVATYDMPELRSIHLSISVKGGSMVESKTEEGVAHFMEHMLVQGIPSFPNAQTLSMYAESLAANYNAFTSHTTVAFSMTAPFSHIKDTLRIASEVFFEPLFPEGAMDKERRAVINEINQNMDSHWYKFNQFYRTTRYISGSSLLLETAGNKEVVEKLTLNDLRTYWEKYFVPTNTYLFLCGNLSKFDLQGFINEFFGKYRSVQEFPGFPKLSDKDLAGRKVAIRNDKELQVNYVNLSFKGLSYYDDILLKVKQDIALSILVRLRTSRLFQLLRYQKGLVYGISVYDFMGLGIGTVGISSEVATEHIDEVIRLMVEEIVSFREKGPLKEELEFTKNYHSNKWLMSFDHPDQIADWVNDSFIWEDKVLMPEDYIAMLKNIEASDIAEIMQEYWSMDKLQLIIQGPLERTQEHLEKYTKMIEPLR